MKYTIDRFKIMHACILNLREASIYDVMKLAQREQLGSPLLCQSDHIDRSKDDFEFD